MEIKEINKIIQSEDKDEKSKSVKCICINYGDFLADCEGFVQKRYHDFKCNPKHQFEKKADTILENAIHEKNFMPDLFLIRLNRKQSACNSQIDFVFELHDLLTHHLSIQFQHLIAAPEFPIQEIALTEIHRYYKSEYKQKALSIH